MKAVIYLRVSTKEQAEEGYSIPAQAEACRRFLADRGWELADEYVDRGESARTADRPQLQAMLARLSEDPGIDCLVVHKLDRLARNLEDHAAVRAALRKAGVQLHSVTESLEDSASGKLVEGILASIAEFYSANLGQEIRKGMDQKAAQGGWPVRAPFGVPKRPSRRPGTPRRVRSRARPAGTDRRLGLRALRYRLAVPLLPHRGPGREGPPEPARQPARHQRGPSDAPKPRLRRRGPPEGRGA